MPDSTSRRGFLAGMGAAVAAPTILLAGRAPVLGGNSHTYELVEDWGTLPAGVAYGYTHGVAEDSQGRIIVHNQSKDAVIIFDEKGKFVKSWGEDFAKGAHGLTLRREGSTDYLYMADTFRNIVVKATVDGEIVWTIGVPEQSGVYPEGKGYKPTNVAVAANGDFYVADGYGSSYIHQYSSKAEYIRTWGGKGSEQGKLNCPHGIWIDNRTATPNVTVADRANKRLQTFSLTGEPIAVVSGDLRAPCHFDEKKGDLYVPDLNGRVTILDHDNKLITHVGDNPGVWKMKGWPNLPKRNWADGAFISPHSACVDQAGNLYVVEWIQVGRVTKLRRV